LKSIKTLLVIIFFNFFSITFSQEIEIYPDHRKKSEIRKNKKAIKEYDKEISQTNNISKLYFERGRAKGKLGDFIGAKEDFSKAIEIDSTIANYYVRRGITKEFLKEYESAINDYSIASKLAPNHKDVFYGLGNCYFHLKDFQNAILNYTKQLQIIPQDYASFTNRGAK